MSSVCPVLDAIALAIAMASNNPKNAIASALLDRVRNRFQSTVGISNDGRVLGTGSSSLTPSSRLGSTSHRSVPEATSAMSKAGSDHLSFLLTALMTKTVATVKIAIPSVGQ